MDTAGCCRNDHVAARRYDENQHGQLASEQRQMTARRRQSMKAIAGFTLLEALVAIALMGLILAALATITAQWLPNWNHGIVRVQRSDDVRLGLSGSLPTLRLPNSSRRAVRPASHYLMAQIVPSYSCGPCLVQIAGPASRLFALPKSWRTRAVLVRTRAPFMPGVDRTQPTLLTPLCCCGPRIGFLLHMQVWIEIGAKTGATRFNYPGPSS